MSLQISRPGLDVASRVIGGFLVGTGIYGIISPYGMARIFGITRVKPRSEGLIFYPGLAVRNMSAGLAVWAFSYLGQRRAIGTLLACWIPVGLVDTKICLDNPGSVNTWVHVMNIGILMTVVPALLRS